MHILVLLKMVPDIVEELEVAPDGKQLSTEFLRLILNERDNHALEAALLLKEKYGGTITALAPDQPEMDEVLFTALAKGVNHARKITGIEVGLSTRQTATALARALKETPGLLPADLILVGCQAIDDLDGHLGPLLAHHLNLPFLGVVTAIAVDTAARKALVRREFAGGVRGEFEVELPAIFGVQAAEKPPRYVPVAKVRAVMKSQKIDSLNLADASSATTAVQVLGLSKPEVSGHAEMLEGEPEELARKLSEILSSRGLV
jgi:electron transfer flavoprotein beta subunit